MLRCRALSGSCPMSVCFGWLIWPTSPHKERKREREGEKPLVACIPWLAVMIDPYPCLQTIKDTLGGEAQFSRNYFFASRHCAFVASLPQRTTQDFCQGISGFFSPAADTRKTRSVFYLNCLEVGEDGASWTGREPGDVHRRQWLSHLRRSSVPGTWIDQPKTPIFPPVVSSRECFSSIKVYHLRKSVAMHCGILVSQSDVDCIWFYRLN